MSYGHNRATPWMEHFVPHMPEIRKKNATMPGKKLAHAME